MDAKGIITQNNILNKEEKELLISFLKNGNLQLLVTDKKLKDSIPNPDKVFKHVIEEIFVENQKYASLFTDAPAGYIVLNGNYQIESANLLASTWLQMDELSGLDFFGFVDEGYRKLVNVFLENIKAGKKIEECQIKFKSDPGLFHIRGTAGLNNSESETFRILFFNSSFQETLETVNVELPGPDKTHGTITESSVKLSPPLVTASDILEKLTILIAEDDEIARIYLNELLKDKCKKVIFAKNGKEAVEIFQNTSYIDLILMDIKMPVMDGYSATIKIKEIDKEIIIVAQTAYVLASDREKALAAGCDDYLAKPLIKKDLFSVIEKFFKQTG